MMTEMNTKMEKEMMTEMNKKEGIVYGADGHLLDETNFEADAPLGVEFYSSFCNGYCVEYFYDLNTAKAYADGDVLYSEMWNGKKLTTKVVS